MVQITDANYLEKNGDINPDKWLQHVKQKRPNDNLEELSQALFLTQLAGREELSRLGYSCLQYGLVMADILEQLGLDCESISSALLYESVQLAELNLDIVAEQVSVQVAKLIEGVKRMSASSSMNSINHSQLTQENVRMMLLAMVEDVRVVLIKLAEQVCLIRASDMLGQAACHLLASECRHIYAPLANRLGLTAIKWELEDRAFRILEPDAYHQIAKLLNERLIDRQDYVTSILTLLKDKLTHMHIKDFKVTGRVKHIYGIYRKMKRKDVDYNQIYDATAVRVLVPSIEMCYRVLDLIHNLWEQIPEEFDDYIANPKANGYQSIHTAVLAEGGKVVEVQIRTDEMHQKNETGVAAHWIYKEGKHQKSSYESKISWLRQVLEWQKELVKQGEALDDQALHISSDRVYVFTPKGDVLDLIEGATPLDFAYTVHTEVGHRCRGAKVNGSIVPLTYQLKTGDQVDVLTGKHPSPSLDWLNPHLGYLKSPRAKAKIHHWFKQQNYTENASRGQAALEAELKRLNLTNAPLDMLVKKYNLKQIEDLYAGIGAGDFSTQQITSVIANAQKRNQPAPPIVSQETKPQTKQNCSDINVLGVGNLLTHVARCCTPVPGEQVIGYITRGKGVSIHKRDCSNILNANEEQQKRLIAVEWGQEQQEVYPISIHIRAYDRNGLLRDITDKVANENISVIGLATTTDKDENIADIKLKVEVKNLQSLGRLLDKLAQIHNVFWVQREPT